jgi:hypothetical protein
VKGRILSSLEEEWTNDRWGIFQVFKKDWVSWPDWLGYGEGKLPVGTFLVFEEAREVARAKEFASEQEVRSHPFDSSLSKAVVKEQLMATHTAFRATN